MANLYLTEIPNAPKPVEMPTAKTQDVPNIRARGVDMKVDMSQEIASLQRKPLPGGFASGMANAVSAQGRIAESAGAGERAMGKAIGEGADKVASGLGKAAYVLHQLNEEALNVKDKVAQVEAQGNRQVISEMFEADAAKENWSPQQRAEKWPEYQEKLTELNSTVGIRESTQAIISAQDGAYGQATLYRIRADGSKKIIQDGYDLINQTIDKGIETGSAENVALARQALDRGVEMNLINEAKRQELDRKLNRSAKVSFIQETAATVEGATWLKTEAEKQQRGEKNDLFTKDDDAAMWNGAVDLSVKTITKTQKENAEALQERIYADPTKVTEKDLKAELDANRLSVDQFAALETLRRGQPIAYNDAAVGDAFVAATTYDFNTDKDANGRQSMAKYDAITKQIMTTVPKEDQPELLAILKANWDRGSKRDDTAQDKEFNLTIQNIDDWWKSGILPDPATRQPLPSGKKGDEIVNQAEYESSNKQRVELQREAAAYRKAHPDFGPNELMDHIYGKMRERGMANATANISGTTSVPLVEGQPGFYGSIAIPGAPRLAKEMKPAEKKPPSMEEARAASTAVKAGIQPPVTEIPAGPGAPVAITVYDKDNAMFREASLPASPELLKVVQKESQIYDSILKQTGGTLREKLAVIEDPDMREGIVRKSLALSKQEKISLDDAGQKVLTEFSEKAKADAAKIEGALKTMSPTASVPTGFFKDKLAGQETAFNVAAQKYGIDPTLLMAIAAHETGRGTSDMVKNKNNPGGLFDSVKDEYMSFPTIEAGIDAMARNLKRNYIDEGLTTIEQIQKKYAEVGAKNDPKGLNKEWAEGVTKFQKQLQAGGASKEMTMEAGQIDPASQKQIASLEPQVQQRAINFMTLAKKWAAENGYEIRVTEGYRSPETQNEYYAQGRTKPGPIITNARAGQSHHQSKKAFDVVITKNGKVVDKKAVWSQLGEIGKAAGLAWGGDFRSIYDPNHFEYMG